MNEARRDVISKHFVILKNESNSLFGVNLSTQNFQLLAKNGMIQN